MSSVEYAGRSDVGRQRPDNQDRWAADDALGLYVVADGIACSNNGALAAQLVCQLLPTYLQRQMDSPDNDEADAAEQLRAAVAEFSDELHMVGRTDLRVLDTGTTVVAAVVAPSRAVIAHLGDSRAYLYRDDSLQRLTFDHNVVEELIQAGEVSPAEAAQHPGRHVLTRHVAMFPPALPDTRTVELRPADRILLCSDGLHGVVGDDAMSEILAAHGVPDDACAALIDAANGAGGPDNVTVLVVDIPPDVASDDPAPH